jgi:hypothetical protein
MERSKKGQIIDLLTIIAGIVLIIYDVTKAHYDTAIVWLAATILFGWNYKIKYKYNRLFKGRKKK